MHQWDLNYNLSKPQAFIQEHLGLSGFSFPVTIEAPSFTQAKQCFQNVSDIVGANEGLVEAQMCWIVYSPTELLQMHCYTEQNPKVLTNGQVPYKPVDKEIMAELHCILFQVATKTYHDVTPDLYELKSRTIVLEPRISLEELQAFQHTHAQITCVQMAFGR